MILFIFLLVVVVAGVAVLLLAKPLAAVTADTSYDKNAKGHPAAWRLIGGGVALIAAAGIIWSASTTIGPSDVGIVTAFGHTEGDIGPGIHFVAPWDGVTIWDDSVQQVSYTSGGKGTTGCLEVRIAGQQSACLDVTIFWKDNPGGSDSQFRQYRTFGRLANAYFSRGVITQYFNRVFESFDPVTLASTTSSGQLGGSEVSSLADTVLRNIQAAYAGQVTITRLSAGQIRYDPQVEAALSSVIKAKANTNVAEQNIKTALAQRTANSDEKSNLTPLVVEQNCLNATIQGLNNGQTWPQGWTCTGSGAGVLVSGSGK